MDALDLANYIVEKQIRTQEFTDAISLQKVLYFVNARFMQFRQKPVPIFNDQIQKWKYGPVVAEVYHTYKLFGPMEITSIPASQAFFWNTDDFLKELREEFGLESRYLDSWIEEFIGRPPFELVDLTHEHALWRQDEERIRGGYLEISYDLNDLLEEIQMNPLRFFGEVREH